MEPTAGPTTWNNPDSSRTRLTAIVDYMDEVISQLNTSKREVTLERLEEDVRICKDFDRAVIPLTLIFAATASMRKRDARDFLSHLPNVLTEEIVSALDRVSETLLMIIDKDLQASGIIATSVLVQRSLPGAIMGREAVLSILLDIVNKEYPQRVVRHGDVFAPLRRVDRAPSLGEVPGLLCGISDALEDLACERDVFLDDPIELVAKRAPPPESLLETLKVARTRSGADLPLLSEELPLIENLAELVGWSREDALALASDLYTRKVMDKRSELGISVSTVCNIVTDINELLQTTVTDLQVDDNRRAEAPYVYDWEQSSVVLHVGYRGGITTKLVRAETPRIHEQLLAQKADREATTLSRAIDRYRAAREAAGGDLVPEDVEAEDVDALCEELGIGQPEAYDVAASLHAGENFRLSASETGGLTLRTIREVLMPIVPPGSLSMLTVDPAEDAITPFRIDPERRALVIHSAFKPLTTPFLRMFLGEYSVEPIPLAEPDAEKAAEYEEPDAPASCANPENIQRLIEEFHLHEEHAEPSFDVLLESSTPFRESISVQTLRVLVATLNERLGEGGPIDVVTGWTRELPESLGTDYSSVAWISDFEEEGEKLKMLTFNFSYGGGKRKLSPLSDEVILEWCRHYKVT